ncbi:hypothetical protein LC612_33090 [Nostoc sp. CHAB 5834]|nr:hypothetical protein [Nostoc sp. CHAB 5834]
MTVDTKGVVATSIKDVLLVSRLAEIGLRAVCTAARKLDTASPPVTTNHLDWRLLPDSAMLQSFVHLRGHPRMMSIFMHCDGDNKDIAPQSLSLSLGANGDSPLIMKSALWGLSMLGPVLFCEHDSHEARWEPLFEAEVDRFNLLKAIGNKLLTPYEYRNMLTAFTGLRINLALPGSFEDAFGVSEEEALAIPRMTFEQSNIWLREKAEPFIDSLPSCFPSKEEDFFSVKKSS